MARRRVVRRAVATVFLRLLVRRVVTLTTVAVALRRADFLVARGLTVVRRCVELFAEARTRPLRLAAWSRLTLRPRLAAARLVPPLAAARLGDRRAAPALVVAFVLFVRDRRPAVGFF